MFSLSNYKIIVTFSLLTLIASACGAPSQTEAQISTAVAQTVQAQDSLTELANISIPTSTPPIEITTTPDLVTANTPAPVIGAPGCTVSASLVGESPPDGTIMKPGEYFFKTWALKNSGTCTWNSTYQLVYWSGDLMGGLTSYPLPEEVAPGETKDISIYLRAPDVDGTATGYWSIQTPWNAYFGVGETNDPFYVQVSVSSAKILQYEITTVTYSIVRDPAKECPANVRYTVYATITTNGPYEFEYYWDQKDGNESGIQIMKFIEAGSQTISREWLVHKGSSPNPRWMQIIVTGPKYHEYDRAVFLNDCP